MEDWILGPPTLLNELQVKGRSAHRHPAVVVSELHGYLGLYLQIILQSHSRKRKRTTERQDRKQLEGRLVFEMYRKVLRAKSWDCRRRPHVEVKAAVGVQSYIKNQEGTIRAQEKSAETQSIWLQKASNLCRWPKQTS